MDTISGGKKQNWKIPFNDKKHKKKTRQKVKKGGVMYLQTGEEGKAFEKKNMEAPLPMKLKY